MRTTIRIDDDLYRRVKALAGRTGRTVGALIEDAVRASLDSHDDASEEVRPLPVFGGSGVMEGVDLGDTRAMRDLMDEDATLDALR